MADWMAAVFQNISSMWSWFLGGSLAYIICRCITLRTGGSNADKVGGGERFVLRLRARVVRTAADGKR